MPEQTASSSSLPSFQLEAVGRATEFCAPIIPVRHSDLQALVHELDHTRTALTHRGRSEAELERIVQAHAREGEPYSMTACRVIRDQLEELHAMERRAVAAERRAAELEKNQPDMDDEQEQAMRLLGFEER